jgi:hypothetical protein
MKPQITFTSLCLLLAMYLSLAPVPAMAGNTIVYNNGLPDGNDAWTISDGFSVSDSFKLSSAANVNAVQFTVALIPGDTFKTVNWTIYSQGANFKVWGTGTANVFVGVGGGNGEYPAEISFPGIQLPAGTYWIKLSNACTSERNPVYWWESGGPSKAVENVVGTIPSESFAIVDPPLDSSNAAPASSAPQSGTILLLGSALLGIVGLVRHKMGP